MDDVAWGRSSPHGEAHGNGARRKHSRRRSDGEGTRRGSAWQDACHGPCARRKSGRDSEDAGRCSCVLGSCLGARSNGGRSARMGVGVAAAASRLSVRTEAAASRAQGAAPARMLAATCPATEGGDRLQVLHAGDEGGVVEKGAPITAAATLPSVVEQAGL